MERSLRLPLDKFKQLQRLEISNLDLQLPGEEASSVDQLLDELTLTDSDSDCHAAAGVPLPSLQHLQLSNAQLVSTSSLLQLTHAPQLTSLHISRSSFMEQRFSSGILSWTNTEAAEQQVAAALASALQRLPRLSVCELLDVPLSEAVMQQLAAMQGLRQVSLACFFGQHAPTCDLQHLPNSITQLHLAGGGLMNYADGDTLLPLLQRLTGLLRLRMQSYLLSPTVLGSATQLQALQLVRCALLPHDPANDFYTEGTACRSWSCACRTGIRSAHHHSASLR